MADQRFEPPSWPPFCKFLNISFRHLILQIWFKFKSNRFVNCSVIANQSFEPPSCPPTRPPFWKILIRIFKNYNLSLNLKQIRLIYGSVTPNQSFEPPSCTPSWLPSWKFLIIICRHLILYSINRYIFSTPPLCVGYVQISFFLSK